MRRSNRAAANLQKVENEKELMRKVEAELEEGLAIIDAGDKGRGVAATKNFEVGNYVCTYQGELVTHKIALERYTKTINI